MAHLLRRILDAPAPGVARGGRASIASLLARLAMLVALAALAMLAGCGGARFPASSGGANAIAPGSPEGLSIFVDLASMRSDPLLSKVVTRAESSTDAKVGELIGRLDRVDFTLATTSDGSSGVAVLWGRLDKDPMRVPMWASMGGAVYKARPAMSSGVVELEGLGKDSLFVVSDTVWVIATGGARDLARAHFEKSGIAPPIPTGGSVLRASAGAPFLAKNAPSADFPPLDRVALDVKAGTASVRASLTFKDEGGAKTAESKLAVLAPLLASLAMRGGAKCAAFEKLSFHVERSAQTVDIELKGLDEAAEAWDPTACPKLGDATAAPPPAPPNDAAAAAAAGRDNSDVKPAPDAVDPKPATEKTPTKANGKPKTKPKRKPKPGSKPKPVEAP